MNFVLQFGAIVMFSSIFPLAAFLCLIFNSCLGWIRHREYKIYKRSESQVSVGIGQYHYMIMFLSHISVVVNIYIFIFTSSTVTNLLVSFNARQVEVCLGEGTNFCTYVDRNDKFFKDEFEFS